MVRLPLFDELSALYFEHGYTLYLVGGSSRDLLLGLEPEDYDFATEATPEEASSFLPPDSDFSFSRFGCVKLGKRWKGAEITTFRTEGGYLDGRHPSEISFVGDIELDSLRRDFTINAIYLDRDYVPHDFHGGLGDLRSGLIRTIGDPYMRFKEDPLRMARAERLASRLGFEIEEATLKALRECYPLLGKLNPAKLKEEERKGWTWQIEESR